MNNDGKVKPTKIDRLAFQIGSHKLTIWMQLILQFCKINLIQLVGFFNRFLYLHLWKGGEDHG